MASKLGFGREFHWCWRALLPFVLLSACHLAAFAADEPAPVRIVAFGDSLTAGYMLPPEQVFSYQLAAALTAKGYAVQMTNAGVTGNTTADGLERLDKSVPEGTEAVILELGANDGLRDIDPSVTRANLAAILAKLEARHIQVLIAGMKLPKSTNAAFEGKFEAIYTDLARTPGLLSTHYFLQGIEDDPTLRLADGIHPSGKAVGIIVEHILPKVEALIARVNEQRAATASKN